MNVDREEHEQTIAWPAPVLRVGLRWDGEEWSTTDVIRVPSMTLPRSDPADPESMTGFYVETLDEKGSLRYRQRMSDPLIGMEAFSESGEITRMAHGAHAIDIEALVPDDVPAVAVRITRRQATDRQSESIELRIDRDRIRSFDEKPDQHAHDEPPHHPRHKYDGEDDGGHDGGHDDDHHG